MKYFKFLLTVLYLCLCFGLPGCVYLYTRAYEGPPRAPEEVAEVYCESTQRMGFSSLDWCFISHVNGISTFEKPLQVHEIPPYPLNQVNVLPGVQSITVQYDVRTAGNHLIYYVPPTVISRESTTLEFVAEAGHTYKIYFEKKDSKLYAWVQDKESDSLVAGVLP